MIVDIYVFVVVNLEVDIILKLWNVCCVSYFIYLSLFYKIFWVYSWDCVWWSIGIVVIGICKCVVRSYGVCGEW